MTDLTDKDFHFGPPDFFWVHGLRFELAGSAWVCGLFELRRRTLVSAACPVPPWEATAWVPSTPLKANGQSPTAALEALQAELDRVHIDAAERARGAELHRASVERIKDRLARGMAHRRKESP